MSVANFITSDTKILCVIGHPIEHSLSPIMHNAALKDLGLNYVYLAFNITPKQLKKAILGIRALEVKGFNVTIPYKEKICAYLDSMNPITKKIGAINTVKNENGFLIGKNTDTEAAKKVLLDAGFELDGKKVLVLGAGGVARGICYAIGELTSEIVIANRTMKRAKNLAKFYNKYFKINIKGINLNKIILKNEIKTSDILINATPVGMYPNINQSPILTDFLHNELQVFDLIYNPIETKLIKDAKAIGCKTLGGVDMLVNQGALSFEWWTNKKPNLQLMKNIVIEKLMMDNVR